MPGRNVRYVDARHRTIVWKTGVACFSDSDILKCLRAFNRIALSTSLHVNRAPAARLLARRETDGVRIGIHALAHTVDPTHAQGFVDRLRPSDVRLAGMCLSKADPQFRFRLVMLGEPRAKLFGCGEKNRGFIAPQCQLAPASAASRTASRVRCPAASTPRVCCRRWQRAHCGWLAPQVRRWPAATA